MPTEFEKGLSASRNPRRVAHDREVAAGLEPPEAPPASEPSSNYSSKFEKKFTPEEKKKQAAKLAELLRKRD